MNDLRLEPDLDHPNSATVRRGDNYYLGLIHEQTKGVWVNSHVVDGKPLSPVPHGPFASREAAFDAFKSALTIKLQFVFSDPRKREWEANLRPALTAVRPPSDDATWLVSIGERQNSGEVWVTVFRNGVKAAENFVPPPANERSIEITAVRLLDGLR